jgi:hypothetical protein
MLIVYADHIEAPLARRWTSPQVLPCDGRDQAPLVPVHRRFSRLHIACGPSLNLHKAKNIVFPPDQINLSPAARRPEVPRHHRVTQRPKMEVSRLFSPPPSAMMRSSLLRRQGMLRQPVQNPKHCPRRSSGEEMPRKHPSRKHKDTPQINCTCLRPRRM